MFLRAFPFFFGLLFLAVPALRAQDTLHIFAVRGGWNIHHKVKKGETVFQLARRYKAPPALMAEANGLTYNDQLREGSVVSVPLGTFNLSGTPPKAKALGRALIYITKEGDDLSSVSRQASVSKTNLQQWNRLRDQTVGTGQRLFVGWVLLDTSATVARPGAVSAAPRPAAAAPKSNIEPVRVFDSRAAEGGGDTAGLAADTLRKPTGETEFLSQTANGSNIATERGVVVLFPSSIHPPNGVYNGFFNGAQRGAIVEVRNLNNGKMVYVKVLGPLPAAKQYVNAAMGISAAARTALGVTDERTLCQFRFAGY